MSTTTRRLRWLGLALAGLVMAACADNSPQDALKPEGPIAREQDKLWDLTFGMATVVFVIVMGAILYVLFRFRARSDDDAPRQVHGNPILEVTLTAIPVVMLFFVAVPTVAEIVDESRTPKGDVLDVTVRGELWWWELEYPDEGVVTANEMHIPVNRPVELTLLSDNVIHSWWIPKLAGKRDVVPGRQNTMLIEASKPGTYMGQCAEFCGLSHAYMRMRVIAHEPDDFDAWVAAQTSEAEVLDVPAPEEEGGAVDLAALSDAAAGQVLFVNRAGATQQCGGCHTVNGLEGAVGKVGPDLTHVASRDAFAGGIFERTPANLAMWLRDPPGEKAGSKMPDLELSEEEIRQLVAYLETLK